MIQIGTTIDNIEYIYRERFQSTGNPLEYPSFDEPYYHTGQHTPDKDLAEALKGDSDVVAASMRIVAACGQLSTTVNKPWYGLMEDLLWARLIVRTGRMFAERSIRVCHNLTLGAGPVLLPRSRQYRRNFA